MIALRTQELEKRDWSYYHTHYGDDWGQRDRQQRKDKQELKREVAAHLEIFRGEKSYEITLARLKAELSDIGPAEWHKAVADLRQEGSYTVTLVPRRALRQEPLGREERLRDMLVLHCGMTWKVADETIKRVKHVAPEPLLEGVSLDDAIEIRTDIELCGAVAKIKEGVKPKAGNREPIPESVRNAVWRRDEARCVDCGSRERLEYDHIVPVSRGGSNTARNIELRCESCNRRKAASI